MQNKLLASNHIPGYMEGKIEAAKGFRVSESKSQNHNKSNCKSDRVARIWCDEMCRVGIGVLGSENGQIGCTDLCRQSSQVCLKR